MCLDAEEGLEGKNSPGAAVLSGPAGSEQEHWGDTSVPCLDRAVSSQLFWGHVMVCSSEKCSAGLENSQLCLGLEQQVFESHLDGPAVILKLAEVKI